MNGNDIMGIFSSIITTVPLLFILMYRLVSYKTFPALGIYFLLVLLFNLCSIQAIPFSGEFREWCTVTNNFFDNLLMLLFLTYLPASVQFKRIIGFCFVVCLAYTLIMISTHGYNLQTTAYTLAPSHLLCLIFTAILTWQHIRTAVYRQRSTGKAFMSASLLFGFGCYSMLYIIFFLIKDSSPADVTLIYFMASMLSSGFFSIGLFFEAGRIRRVRELQITRRELMMIYGQQPMKRATSLEAALFPREQFNQFL
ncbi:hypothetical protein JMG10_15140 [Nostoc ellipsosporum NOK]|jgi:hypothetical protein|nr:hypothetical protein [Nostoc ellipsosporum NOK]